MMLLDKSLDEIIASRSTQMRRAPRRAGRRIVRGRITGRLNGRVGGRAGRVGTRRLRGIVSSTAAAIQAVIDEGSKIIVSNLIEIVLDPKMSLAASSLSQRVTSELPRTRRTGALRRAGRFRSSRPRKTAEELDAEMIDYFGSANQEPAT
ncbi:unnamed protein product [Pneumocystis jirovecii]|uniref:Chromatin target of PRMT1 protein C-terminal domain-containing protein n=1 Tax=Pneumocystis jirovecii TaxID=42068 RepID=L0PEY8_PNEJI|nr:unnamed protein product [Pneumocystis jirovecii]